MGQGNVRIERDGALKAGDRIREFAVVQINAAQSKMDGRLLRVQQLRRMQRDQGVIGPGLLQRRASQLQVIFDRHLVY